MTDKFEAITLTLKGKFPFAPPPPPQTYMDTHAHRDPKASGGLGLWWFAHSSRLIITPCSVCRFTLHHGVPINATDDQGNTALHYAAEAGHLEVVQLLVEIGADASVVNKVGCSPLQEAAENRHQEVADYLIQVSCFASLYWHLQICASSV